MGPTGVAANAVGSSECALQYIFCQATRLRWQLPLRSMPVSAERGSLLRGVCLVIGQLKLDNSSVNCPGRSCTNCRS